MPIHKLPNGKYRWGGHGKEYDTKEEAQAQSRAAYASGYTGKNDISKIFETTRSDFQK